jgi:hypothetical protein
MDPVSIPRAALLETDLISESAFLLLPGPGLLRRPGVGGSLGRLRGRRRQHAKHARSVDPTSAVARSGVRCSIWFVSFCDSSAGARLGLSDTSATIRMAARIDAPAAGCMPDLGGKWREALVPLAGLFSSLKHSHP